ncbi:TPA: hypothetical protein N2817_004515 [Vibrio parahaemolyticus]|nr:hypothetical protein [Vibrio parahaemolyticus]
MEYVSNSHYLGEKIKTLSDDRNASSYKGGFYITAQVGGKTKVSNEYIECMLVKHHDRADVSVFWEDHGFKNYRDMGLFGLMNSNYFSINILSDTSFELEDDNGAYTLIFSW